MRVIRPETPDDYAAVREVNELAFAGDVEATLVDRLRADGVVLASLVAEEDSRVVGHILFSELPIRTSSGEIPAAALAPMAVHPDRQRQGIGGDLVWAGLAACKHAGKAVVIIVGHAEYYTKFGFSAELARAISSPYSEYGTAWMAIELEPGVLAGITGSVTYPKAFQS